MKKEQMGIDPHPIYPKSFPLFPKEAKFFWIGGVMVGIFDYWIGLSFRNPKPYWTIDLGYIKFMWLKK